MLGAGALALGLASPESSSAADVELKAATPKVELAASGETTAFVLVTNTGSSKVSHLRVRAVATGASPARVVRPGRIATLKAGETRTYRVLLRPWRSARPPAPLSLLATFETSGGVRDAASASVELTPPTALDVDEIASVEVKASLATLRADQTQPVYLLVKNKAAQTLTVKRVDTENAPSFIVFKGAETDVRIEPGETSVLRLEAEADSRVKPGEHQLVFVLPSTMGGADFDLVASQTTKVGVEGETELLTIFGIPSLLLLPGFLLLTTVSLLWRLRLGRGEWDLEDFPFPFKEGEFWVLAVLGSIGILTGAHLVGLDLLDEYSFLELVWLWIASMLIGGAVYLVVVVARNTWRSRRVPSEEDGPIEVLRKLERQRLKLDRPTFSVDVNGAAEKRFLLQPPNAKRAVTWISPKIEYRWVELDQELNEAINEDVNRGAAGALAKGLAQGEEKGALTVVFRGGGTPMPMVSEKVEPKGSDVIAAEGAQ